MRFALEALQANDGDCLLLHFSAGSGDAGHARPGPHRWRLARHLQERAEAAARRAARPGPARSADGDGQPHRRGPHHRHRRLVQGPERAAERRRRSVLPGPHDLVQRVRAGSRRGASDRGGRDRGVPWRPGDPGARRADAGGGREHPAGQRAPAARHGSRRRVQRGRRHAAGDVAGRGRADGSHRARPDVHHPGAAEGAARPPRTRLDQGAGGPSRGSRRADGRLPEQHRPQHVEHRRAGRSRRGRPGVQAHAADGGCARRRDSGGAGARPACSTAPAACTSIC